MLADGIFGISNGSLIVLDLNRLIDRVCDLVSLPDVYMRLRRALADPKSDLGSVAAILETDPAVAARLLRVANSPLFGFAAKVDSVSRAVTLLGTQRVHDLVLSTTIATMFKGLNYDATNVYQFWKTSVLRASAAKILAQEAGIKSSSDRLFLLGLLSDIGHLVLYEHEARQMQAVYTHSSDKQIPLYQAERDLLGFDYAAVGSQLAERWKMPELFVGVIGEHVTPDQDSSYALETCIVHTAWAIAVEPFEAEACYASLSPVVLDTLEPTSEQLAALREAAEGMVGETLSLIYS